MSAKWKDLRLQYRYLKDDASLNVIDKNMIWTPQFQFTNLKKAISSVHHGTVVKKGGNDYVVNDNHKSDEKNCSLAAFTDDYEKQNPPASDKILTQFILSNRNITKTDVNVLVDIHDIYDINEVTSTIIIRFSMSAKWKDLRLQYRYLKDDASLNVIDKNMIWTPQFQFTNLKKAISSVHHGTVVKKGGNDYVVNDNHKSDEKNCSLAAFTDDYEKQNPPASDKILTQFILSNRNITKTDVKLAHFLN
jgi:hypothetical protein